MSPEKRLERASAMPPASLQELRVQGKLVVVVVSLLVARPVLPAPAAVLFCQHAAVAHFGRARGHIAQVLPLAGWVRGLVCLGRLLEDASPPWVGLGLRPERRSAKPGNTPPSEAASAALKRRHAPVHCPVKLWGLLVFDPTPYTSVWPATAPRACRGSDLPRSSKASHGYDLPRSTTACHGPCSLLRLEGGVRLTPCYVKITPHSRHLHSSHGAAAARRFTHHTPAQRPSHNAPQSGGGREGSSRQARAQRARRATGVPPTDAPCSATCVLATRADGLERQPSHRKHRVPAGTEDAVQGEKVATGALFALNGDGK
jgi:hypothetical protein